MSSHLQLLPVVGGQHFESAESSLRGPTDFFTLILHAAAALRDETASAEDRITHVQAMLRRWGVAQTAKLKHADASPLSPRENAVLRLICGGLSNKRIARSLQIAPETVKSHAKHILKKLNAQTRAEAVALAAEMSLFA
jgi:LuxR family maltose regulon positive regulatory protein